MTMEGREGCGRHADTIARMALETFDELGDADAEAELRRAAVAEAREYHDDFLWTPSTPSESAEDPTPLRERFHSHDSVTGGDRADDLPSGFLSAPQLDDTYIRGGIHPRPSNGGVGQEPTAPGHSNCPSGDDSKCASNEGESLTPKVDRFITDHICGTQGRLNHDDAMMVLDDDEQHADHCDCTAWSCLLGGHFSGLEMRRPSAKVVSI